MYLNIANRRLDIAYRPQSSDEIVIQEAAGDIYQLGKIVKPDQLWIDAGANIGTTTLSILAHGAGILASVEADVNNYNLLKDNIARNGYFDIPLFNKMLIPNAGRWSLEAADEPWHHQGRLDPEGEEGITLADLTHNVDTYCLKMDIEGMEAPIILETDPDVLAKCEALVMEFHHDRLDSEVFEACLERLHLVGMKTQASEVQLAHKNLLTPYILHAWR